MSRQFTRDFLIEVAKGDIAGHTLVHKFGRNDTVPNASWAFINELGFTAWPLSAATTVRVKAGGDAADTAAGAGARGITVVGLDNTLTSATETIATAGAAASAATTTSFWRIHRAYISSVGTYGAGNTGAVVIENSGGGTDVIGISAGEGQSQFGGVSVPTATTGYLLSSHVQVDTNKRANIRAFTREDLSNTAAPMSPKRIRQFFDGVSGEYNFVPPGPPLVVPAETDLWFEAFGDGGTVEVSIDFLILFVSD